MPQLNLLFGALLLSLLPFIAQAAPQQLTWEELVPAEFRFDEAYDALNLDDLEDDDPRVEVAMAKLRAMWDAAPTVAALDNKLVRLPGFVVPLDGEGGRISEFLLVPYMGACIHVPPPPANQIVYVKAGKENTAAREPFDTVWVTGRMRTQRSSNELGESGYLIEATRIEPYE